MSRKSVNLGARLRRSRALSVCLGRRSWYLKPLDRCPGRPTLKESAILDCFKKPVVEYDPDCYDDQVLCARYRDILLDSCDAYLDAAGIDQGWFEVTERANLLGTHVTVFVRSFDVLVVSANLLALQLGNISFVRDRMSFCDDGKGVSCG